MDKDNVFLDKEISIDKVRYRIRKSAHASFELLKINLEPYEMREVIFTGSISDCLAYVTALKNGLID